MVLKNVGNYYKHDIAVGLHGRYRRTAGDVLEPAQVNFEPTLISFPNPKFFIWPLTLSRFSYAVSDHYLDISQMASSDLLHNYQQIGYNNTFHAGFCHSKYCE